MSKREIPKPVSRLQKPGTSISRTDESQLTKTNSGTKIAATSRISQTTVRPPASRIGGPSNVGRGLKPPTITGAAKVLMAGAPSTSRPQSGIKPQQVTQVKLSGLPGRPVAVRGKKAPAAKGKAGGTCPPTCSLPGAVEPFTAEIEAGKHVPPGMYYMPLRGAAKDVSSPVELRAKLTKYTPTSLSHYKVDNEYPLKMNLAPLRQQHPDIRAAHFRTVRDVPEADFESAEQIAQQNAFNQSMKAYLSEDAWTVGLREAMDLEQGEMETEDGLLEYEQSTIDKSFDGQLGSPGLSQTSPCLPCSPGASGLPPQRQDYISPPREDITRPETHYNVEQRAVSPARIVSPRGLIEAKQTFHIERQMGASPHGAVVDTTLIGTRTISPGQAEQIEITKRDRIPTPKTPSSASKRRSPPVSPGSSRRYSSPPASPASTGRYPSPPIPSASSRRYSSPPASPGSTGRYPSPSISPGSSGRYPSPLEFQASPPSYPSPHEFQASPPSYPSPPDFLPSPDRSQFLGSPLEYFEPSEPMAVCPGSPQRYAAQPQAPRTPQPPQAPRTPQQPQRTPPQVSRSPPRFPSGPSGLTESIIVEPGIPTRGPSPPMSPSRNRRGDSPVSFDLPGSAKSPSAPGGPLDISIPVPSSPKDATIDVIQDLIDEERIDFQASATLSPLLQDKLDRIRAHNLLVETLQEIVPGDDADSSGSKDKSPTKSDMLASMMYSQERGVIDTGSSPKKTYNALFGAKAALAVSLEGEKSITVSPAAPAPLQDIVVPVGQANVDDIAMVNSEMSAFVASTDEMPKGDAYSTFIQDSTSPTRIPVPKSPKADKTGIAYVDEDGEETKYIPRGELEEQKAPWDIDLDSLEDLVGGQLSFMSPMRSDESIHKTMKRFEYVLDLERPKHYSCVQLRGTQRPPWFPGYYYVMPQTGSGEFSEDPAVNYVKQGNDLERVFAEAWNTFKPQTVEGNSEVVLL